VTTEERDLLVLHLAFTAVGVAALGLRGEIAAGVVLTALVALYHLFSPLVALIRGHQRWLRWWGFGAVLSLFMVLPDAVLAEGLRTLAFPSPGVPTLGPVPIYMAGLWAVPTVLIVATAEAVAHRRDDVAASVTAVLAAGIVFGLAEATLTLLPAWEPVGVTTWGGFAPYILPAELLLGWMMFAGARWTRRDRFRAVVPVAAAIAITYTGAAAVSWLLIEGASAV
jgi:hypothetical protein